MTRGNRSILTASDANKHLRLFRSDATGYVTYLGQAEYVDHTFRTISGAGTADNHQGIVFTLRLLP